ncbi:LysR substrate-binding domain-containing protein [Paraburkholderia humisilvae]|uniref:HTH-type transcriptional regulator GltR n=1 Tax=Paraburkholderia humisilvae TaxID=627669 RepID=A0A6J5DN27_9BURK|nr:LysR substrate-binding domain-containing protein [Paraburkholderia humisilvae]CAB3755720.1 HTH-type transcriptional regulator GltR [Paraburkholderia humisilvae]
MSAIRYFVTFLSVARHGSFAAAADEVCLTQAAVSQQMRSLERDLDIVLFERTPRSVSLSEQGRTILPLAETLVANYRKILAVGERDEVAGVVRVGALVSSLMGAFADAMLNLKRRYPRLELKLFTGLSSDFATRVDSGELDAAIVTQSPTGFPATLKWTALYSEPMVLISSTDDPRTDVDALLQEPYIRFDRQTWTGILIEEALQGLGASVRDIMELNSLEAICEMVKRGFGVSIVPRLANANWNLESGLRVTALPERIAPRRVGLLERREHGREAFTDAVKRHFTDGADEPAASGSRGADADAGAGVDAGADASSSSD